MGTTFTVMHGDTAIPVTIDSDDALDDMAIQAAASAQLHMKAKPFVVYGPVGEHLGTFTTSDIDEWWA